jgi:hypothetical protein
VALSDGSRVGVDSTPLEANAALRSIVRKDSGESYREFLTGLAHASGIETPTQSDLAKIDKDRKHKGSNADWQHPDDPDAKITKMKDGSTHLAHKVEHVVDLGEGGHWQGEHGAESQHAVYGNRRRIRGERGKRLLKRRGEFLERTFAHCYETGGLRRLHVRGHANIRKRLLVHAAAFNLSLMLRKLLGAGTPRGFQGLLAAIRRALLPAVTALRAITLLPKASQLSFGQRHSLFHCHCATTAA